MSDVPVKSVKKALDLLSELAFCDPEGKGLALTTLARKLGLPSNTTHNLLKTMTTCGYVAQHESGLYTTGPQCRSIGITNRVESDRFRQRVCDVMTRRTEILNEAMVFAFLRGGRRTVLARSAPDKQAIRIDPKANEAPGIYRVPTGRVLTAFASSEDSLKISAQYGAPGTAWPEYDVDIDDIRQSGECVMLGDNHGTHAFAAAVLDSNGRLLGAIGCHAPAFRCKRSSQNKIRAGLQAVARELTNA